MMNPPSDERSHGDPPPDSSEERVHFRRTFLRVMSVQLAALLLLGWLQFRYTH